MVRLQAAWESLLWEPEVKMILDIVDLSVGRIVEKLVEKQPVEVEVKKQKVLTLTWAAAAAAADKLNADLTDGVAV